MKNAARRTILASAVAAAALGLSASPALADTISTVSFTAQDNTTISAVRYEPSGFAEGSGYAAVVMLHGCTGMWSNRTVGATNGDGSPNLQNYVEKWGRALAAQGIVALAVDSYTARKPASAASAEWQNQCSGATYAGSVNPYTTRVGDARAAYDFLAGDSRIDAGAIAQLGWSQGGETALIQAAETSRTSDTARATSERVFAATVVFYPGCGSSLGFGSPSSGYYRPYHDLRINAGDADTLYGNCQTRADRAVSTYGSTAGSGHEVIFEGYAGAGHNFDNVSQSWPSAACTGTSTTGDQCAMQDADIDSLDFLMSRI